jgi:DNA-binding NtrC family response regulator
VVYCDRVPSGGFFAVRDLDLLVVFAAHAALLFELGRLGDEVARGGRARTAALAAVGDAVVALGPDGAVEALNAAATRLLGGSAPARLTDWPELLALAGGEEVDLAPVQLPGGACLVRTRHARDDSGGRVGVVLALTETQRPSAAPPPETRFDDVVASSPLMQKRVRAAEAAGLHGSNVIVGGEPGTGKRLLARAIANAGPAPAPVAAVDCAALPRARGPLFGRPGIIDLSDGGTLILNEVGALPPDEQERLLGALGARRGGGRILATSSRQPDDQSRRFLGVLRERLGAVYLELPPLRDRPEDVPLLVERFAERAAQRLGKAARGATPEVLAALRAHAWPGNVRELEDLVEHEVAMAPPELELLFEMPAALAARLRPPGVGPEASTVRTLAEVELELLVLALRLHSGNVPKVARSLGVSKGTVYNMMRKYHVDPSSFRVSP